MKFVRTMLLTLPLAWATTLLGANPRVAVYPSGPTVPENLLRIELRFSAPLHLPVKLDQLKLVDASGVAIQDPFLDLLLPGRDGRRVTILFHPGRIKTGVGANLALGRALHVGAQVTLVINHPELGHAVYKTWRVTPFDGKSPQPARWTFVPPQAGRRAALVVHLDKAISSTAENLIAIRGPDGERLEGNGRLEAQETVWRFTPLQPWQAGNYAVVTHPDLEDVAGNRPAAPFEVHGVNQVPLGRETTKSFEVFASK